MNPQLSAIVLSLFPDMFPGPLGHSLAGKALENGIWSLETLNIRDFSTDKHRSVDDSPYGGGTGMVMRPDVVHAAVAAAKEKLPKAKIIYTSPRGTPLTQPLANELKSLDLIILCGRFEGVDQRVIDHHDMLEISLGDFVLSGGELAAMTILDTCVRLLPGVIGKEDATAQESFGLDQEYAGLLEYSHYTRPPLWEGQSVPDVLMSGNHEEIKAWRLKQAKEITKLRRPDMLMDKKE
ncbi:MAG: tRNA (guanosine(37)-N1)-methyltransferase TrmD [Rickettsiales bacterium]